MAKHSKREPKSLRAVPPKKKISPPIDLGELWLRVRSGAANVAGVRYQLAVTAFMLAGAREVLGVEDLAPEGLEDIDCRLADSRLLLVQTKDRAGGDARFGLSHVRAALDHAADALRLDPDARFALVTDAELTGGLAETGFDRSVADALPQVAEKLVREADPSDRSLLESSLLRMHIVRLEWTEVHERARRRLEGSYQLRPAIAAIAYATLLEKVSSAAADQRHQARDTAFRFRPSDLDALIHGLRNVIDVERLERAERDGLIEPIDFLRPIDLTPERFLFGVDVEPGHIAANLDVVRADELGQIFSSLHEDQYVLIAGPSGAGKSALLWRAAYEFAGRLRVLRLRRVGSHDVTEVLRYVEGQRPSPQAPILICGDDLGHPSLAGWEEAVDRLLELPGVYVAGSVREEDFRSVLLRGRAKVVRPFLNWRLAEEVVAQLRRREVSFSIEPDEAFARADGLLMEFLTLLIVGRRLRDIVNAQVEERLAPDRTVEREILRYVATAHVYAVTLPASALSTLIPLPNELPSALHRLEDEFMVQRVAASRWSGLHELRSRTVTTRLHRLPPPSETETLARLLPVIDARDRRTLLVAASLAGHDLSSFAAAADELLATGLLDAAAIYSLLDGFIEAEELIHARACLQFVRRQEPARDALSVLPVLQGLRDGWMKPMTGLPNGDVLDALAADLPARGPSIAAATAARLSEQQLTLALAASPPSAAVELLELLAFLERWLPIAPVKELIERIRAGGNIALLARAVAALAQATPESLCQLDRIAGTLESRLDTIAEYRRDVLSWELSGSEDKKTVKIEASEHGEGNLNDRLVGICRLVYEACPEVEQVDIYGLAADGSMSILPDGHKAPARRYVVNPIREIRRNVAFGEALARLPAADSWSERLRRQEELVREITTALDDAIPRLLNPHDNSSRIHSWLERVNRVRGSVDQLPAVPVPPSASIDRSDKAKSVLDRLSHALTQLGEMILRRSFDNLLSLGSQFQEAFGKVQESPAAAIGASAATREWPIVQRLLTQLEGLREISGLLAGLLLALQHDRNLLQRVPRSKTESWRDVATRVVAQRRDVVLRQERETLERTLDGLPFRLWSIHREGSGIVRLVNDLWLIVCEPGHWLEAGQRLLILPEEARNAVVFRTYIAAALGGLVLPTAFRMLGRYELRPFLYPVSLTDANAIAEEAGVDYLRSPQIDEALQALGRVGHASVLAALYRLRDERFSREPERAAANAAIEEALHAIEQVRDSGVRAHLMEALDLVAGELDGPRAQSLAAEMQATVFNQRVTEASRIAAAVVTDAMTAALLERISNSAQPEST